MGQNDPRGAGDFQWKRSEGQGVWIKIGLAFLVFYVCEAILFWNGLAKAEPLMRRIPLADPVIWPLGYWALFGAVVYFLQRKSRSCQTRNAAVARFRRWQGAILSAAITIGVIGVAFVVIRESGNVTLGHVALFIALFLAAGVIGAMELNVGWLAAAGLWLLTALALDFYPAGLRLCRPLSDQDVLIGVAMVTGFFLIGAFTQHVDRRWLDAREEP